MLEAKVRFEQGTYSMPILAQNALLSGLIVYSLRLQAHQLETLYRAAGLAEAAFAEQQETQYREADEGYVTSTFPAHTAFTHSDCTAAAHY